MALTKEQKKKILEVLETAVAAPSVAFVHFQNLKVDDANNLRRSLQNEGVSYKVAKKTLLGLALDKVKVAGDRPAFDGEIAVAWAEDLVAPARGIYSFQKELDGAVELVGGIFEGAYQDKDAIMQIATIPPTPQLRGMFVNVINSPIQGLVIALNQLAEKRNT